jgi:hypothetical protein
LDVFRYLADDCTLPDSAAPLTSFQLRVLMSSVGFRQFRAQIADRNQLDVAARQRGKYVRKGINSASDVTDAQDSFIR